MAGLTLHGVKRVRGISPGIIFTVMRCMPGDGHPDWLYRGAQSDGIAFRVFSRLLYHLIAKIKETFFQVKYARRVSRRS